MRKTLISIALGFVVTATIASQSPPRTDDVQIRILSLANVPPPYTNLNSDVRELARIYDVPLEKMAKAVEGVILENLSALEKTPEKDSRTNLTSFEYRLAFLRTIRSIEMLQYANSPDSLAVLRECAKSTGTGIRHNALRIAQILGVDLDDPNAVIQVTTPEPAQPPVTTVVEIPPKQDEAAKGRATASSPSREDNEPQNEPVENKGVQWQLPLLIAMLAIGGGIVIWRFSQSRA